jgi:hypothetical protein
MSTAPYEYRNGASTGLPFDDKMQQIRELLFGEFKRDSDARLALIEAQVREVEQGLHRKLDAIQSRLDALAGTVTNERQQSFDELAQSLSDLSRRVQEIARK